ncbi:MAG: hypothetical protein ACRDFX_12370 [Chloroflexota bacterium]
MSRCSPQSQTRAVLREKEALARTLLGRGLTVTQIKLQLNCSAQFVRRIRDQEMEGA